MTLTGVRGGVTRSLEEGQALIEAHKPDVAGRIRLQILAIAQENGEIHADDLSHPGNVVGAQFNALAKRGQLEKLNKEGEVEHRASRKPDSHGRRSYVWRIPADSKVGAGDGARTLTGTPSAASADLGAVTLDHIDEARERIARREAELDKQGIAHPPITLEHVALVAGRIADREA